MELREFFAIFIYYKKIFFAIILCSMTIAVVFYFIQPQNFKTSLTLNITRDQRAQTNDYSYDDFYRLQADERFADTVVQWIKEPFFTVEIFGSHNAENISAKRLSSQAINVSYRTRTSEQAAYVAQNLVQKINLQTQALNQKQMQDGWFLIMGTDPVITYATHSLTFLMGLFTSIGVFIAFWTVMIIHYLIGISHKK
jgi:hypothetical protein